MTKCSVEGCERLTHAKGWCRPHWSRMHRFGRLEKIRGIDKGICKVEDCNNHADSLGLCKLHYHRQYTTGRLHKVNGDKRKHPFYTLWHERKRANLLCDEWLDFNKFIENISPKPDGFYFLTRIINEKYGPNNFKWVEHLKRKEIETDQEWWSRKWASKTDRQRLEIHLQKNFNISVEQYEAKIWLQQDRCAICGNNETSRSKKGTVNRLAVDHCHQTGKIRDLLCWRCNSILGKVQDSTEYLQKMIDYIRKHNNGS